MANTRALPERGRIGIFNRSYYEEVLIVRVHPEILQAEGFPMGPTTTRQSGSDRYRSIGDLERHLHRTEPASSNSSFISQRTSSESASWRDRRTGEKLEIQSGRHRGAKILGSVYGGLRTVPRCDQHVNSPWYVVPADDKKTARLIVSQIVLDTFEGLDLAYPKTTAERRQELLTIRQKLEK